ncbi:MAG: DNA-3-methyladenine glycosylase [Flavobacteriales bacterium Tduv]
MYLWNDRKNRAYKSPEYYDSHAFGNKRKARTKAMFFRGCSAYVYLIYGSYKLFNIVTHKAGIATCRSGKGLELIKGINIMLT